ncbi:threonine synthase [Thiomonas delicata]|uniref:Threonine synthase n=1 Tax=Thiomonas delicata TaxID=364030 RepID=A0A238D8P8_THIDL|nr:threonine synthase [Thiomonas delicata]SBP89601.1 Threonine synthase [Thiomonas delicata]
MNYLSTRGEAAQRQFDDILLEGLAPDGGLYLPDHYPSLTRGDLQSLQGLSYPDLAFEILRRYTAPADAAALRQLVHATYTAEHFGSDEIVRIKPLSGGMALLGVSEGPTLAFKDMAMQLLGRLFEHALARSGEVLNILGATSGDTGSAAEYAMRGRHGIRVFMLSPFGKMSPFQTAQMYSLTDDNIHNIAVQDVFDTCQDMVKAVSGDLEFKRRHRIGTINSINWARVVAQVVYYFAGYLRTARSIGDPVSFAVPSGNFGNILAAHVARQMGLPIHKLILATNENNVLDEFFRTGVYRPRGPAETHHTSSPSMDISKASNFERYVFDMLGRNASRTRDLFERQLTERGFFDLSHDPAYVRMRSSGMVSGHSNHAQRVQTIREVWQRDRVMIDPHTADGVAVARSHQDEGVPMLVVETALPAKFSATLVEAIAQEPPRPPGSEDLERRPQRFTVMKPDVDALKAYITQHV